MNKIYLGIKFALSYFTILPVPFSPGDNLSQRRVLATMLAVFPPIGALLAGLSIGIFLALESLGWFAAVLAGVSYMALYGFLHTEAVIDVADAAYAAHSGKDPYAVIKEPTVGAMGVLYGAAFLLLKTAALSTLLMHHLFWPFVAIALISRFSLLLLIKALTFRSTFVSQLSASLPLLPLIIPGAVYAAAGFGFLGWSFALLALLGTSAAFLLAALMRRSLGFHNGDTLGASLEGVELILMIGVLAAWS